MNLLELPQTQDPLKRLLIMEEFFVQQAEQAICFMGLLGVSDDDVRVAMHMASLATQESTCCPGHAQLNVHRANSVYQQMMFPIEEA